MVKPIETKVNMLPASAWLIVNSSSMIGIRGDSTVLQEKLRYHRPQKRKSGSIFMAGVYSLRGGFTTIMYNQEWLISAVCLEAAGSQHQRGSELNGNGSGKGTKPETS